MYIPDPAPRRQARFLPPGRGLSIIELLMFIVIVSIALVAILNVQIQSSRISADPQLRKQALAIAEGLLEEITLARFTFCDPQDANADSAATPASCATLPEVVAQEAGGVDRPYDNVNDYVDTFGTAKVYNKDAAGFAYPAGYTVKVTISPDAGLGPLAGPITPADATSANMNVLRIRVAVTYPNSAEDLVLDAYRTRYAPNSLP
jgi:MSHA pilin protein MshD